MDSLNIGSGHVFVVMKYCHINKLHAYRLYLQVTLLSDITNLKGDKILSSSLQGKRAQHRSSAYGWPRQQRPNTHSWKL